MTEAAPTSGRGLPRGIRAGAAAVAVAVAAVMIGPDVLPIDGEAMHADAILAAPSLAHALGTDQLGRDILARTVLGGRSTIALALGASVAGVGLGALAGLVAGYRQGVLDAVVMRVGDAIMAIPSLVLAMLVVVTVGNGPAAIVTAIVLILAPRAARIIRSSVLNLVRLEFVTAAAVVGESRRAVMFREIVPNIWPNIVVEFCLRFTYAVLLVGSLGYLGIGIQPPTPDWGQMVSDGSSYMLVAPWVIVGPAVAIFVTVVGVNLLGDRLQEHLNARLRRAEPLV